MVGQFQAPYGVIADCFRNQSVVLFLGAAASFVGNIDSMLPSGAQLAQIFASKSGYPGGPSDSLTKVAQYIEEIAAGRDFLLRDISKTFGDNIASNYRCSVTDFLAVLPAPLIPRLIITTNYDVLVERALESLNVPYIAISHVMRGTKNAGRLVCYESLTETMNIITRTELENKLGVANESDDQVLVYKMHGTSRIGDERNRVDSIVLTETDYVDFLAEDMLSKMPTRILQTLRTAHLLFLGYSLADWNFRVLLQRVHKIQRRRSDGGQKHWACLLDPDPVEDQFWKKRDVTIYPQPLDSFLESLTRSITGDST